MNSRYDFMREGTVKDEKSGSLYPDPLSLNYLNFDVTEIPYEDKLTDNKIRLLWLEAQSLYGTACWDDIVLTLNGVPHKNFLRTGDSLHFPSQSDIIKSFERGRNI